MTQKPRSLMISGESGSGKSWSLKNLKNQRGVLYLNCEAGKPLPFRNQFVHRNVVDPLDIEGYYEAIADDDQKRFHTIVIDTASFMMDAYEAIHVQNAANTMKAWGEYGAFFRRLMNQHVAVSPAMTIFLGHLKSELDEEAGVVRTSVPVKGALKNAGLEAFFTTVINVRKERTKNLKPNTLLTISEEEEELGFKHVFQTRTVKATVGDRIRSPEGLFSKDETYINNDAQVVLDRLVDYFS